MEGTPIDTHHYDDPPEGSPSRQNPQMSAARRKEANRLAANKSRARRAERLMALEVAAQALAEENLGLKEQISKVVAGRQGSDPSKAVFEALMSGPENWDVEGLFGEFGTAAAATAGARPAESEQDRLGDLATAAVGAGAGVEAPNPVPTLASTLPAIAPSSFHMLFNSDMEYSLRQEILDKRAQLAALPSHQAGQLKMPSEQKTLLDTQAAIDQVNAQTEVLRTVVAALRADIDAIDQERKALKASLLETQGDPEAEKIEAILKSVRAHVVDHLGGATETIAIPPPITIIAPQALANPSSPATPSAEIRGARRLRPIAAATTPREMPTFVRQAARRSRGRTQAQFRRDAEGEIAQAEQRELHQLGRVPFNTSQIDPRLGEEHGQEDEHDTIEEQLHDDTEQQQDQDQQHDDEMLDDQHEHSQSHEQEQGDEQLHEQDHEHHDELDHESDHDAFLLSTLAHQHEQHNHELDAATFASLLPDNDVDVDIEMQHRDSMPPEDNTVAPDDFPQPGDAHLHYGSPSLVESANSKRQVPTGNCEICGRKETSVWRKLVHDGIEKRVCNACGLYFQKFGKVRPPSLWGDGRSVKKRRVVEVIPDGPRVKRGRPPGSTKKTAQARALEFEQRRQAAEAAQAGVEVGMEIEQQLGDVFAQHQAQMHLQGQDDEGMGQEEEEPSAGMGIGHELDVEGLGV